MNYIFECANDSILRLAAYLDHQGILEVFQCLNEALSDDVLSIIADKAVPVTKVCDSDVEHAIREAQRACDLGKHKFWLGSKWWTIDVCDHMYSYWLSIQVISSDSYFQWVVNYCPSDTNTSFLIAHDVFDMFDLIFRVMAALVRGIVGNELSCE